LLLQKWYWCGRSVSSVEADRTNIDDVADYGDKAAFFEKPSSARVGIKIRNLTKVFYNFSFNQITNAEREINAIAKRKTMHKYEYFLVLRLANIQ
jgi:hypothetical protein